MKFFWGQSLKLHHGYQISVHTRTRTILIIGRNHRDAKRRAKMMLKEAGV